MDKNIFSGLRGWLGEKEEKSPGEVVGELQKEEKDEKEPPPRLQPGRSVLYSWRSPEFVYQEKGRKWYWAGGALLAALLLAAALTRNFLMGVTFLLLGGVGYIYSKKQPREVEFKILREGIEADGIFYNYETLGSFWIFYDNPPEDAFLSVQRAQKYLPYLELPLGEADPVNIRKELLKFLEEKRHEKKLASTVEKLIKF